MEVQVACHNEESGLTSLRYDLEQVARSRGIQGQVPYLVENGQVVVAQDTVNLLDHGAIGKGVIDGLRKALRGREEHPVTCVNGFDAQC